MLITAMWYTRRQQPIRMGLWYTANGKFWNNSTGLVNADCRVRMQDSELLSVDFLVSA